MFYSPEAASELWDVVASHTATAGIPVLANVDCGHTNPMVTLPLGCPARLDAGAETFATLEPATAPK